MMSALQKLKRKSKGAKAKTVKPGPKDPPPALDNSHNTTQSLNSGSVISVREATAVYKQDNVSQNDDPRDDTTVLDQTDPQPSTSQTNPSLHDNSHDADNQITQSSTRFAPEPDFRQRISSATMETVVQPAHSTSSDQLVPFAAAELNNAHAYVPYLYARDSVAKVVADMKKMKSNHIHFVDQIELRYGKIEEESQAQFNTFVVNLGQSYGKKVKTFRQVIDVHRIELQQKQEYWDAALVSLGGTNKQLLNEKKKLLIRNKLDHEYAENEIENSLKHLTVKLDGANAVIADLREKEHKVEKEKEGELHEMEKNVKDECEREKQEIQDEVIHLRKIVAELKKNPNSAAAVSIATASVAMDNSRDETRTLKAEVEETVQPYTYIETTARAPAVVISDLSEEERQKMEDERNEMKEERQKMKKERAAMDKEMEKFIADRNSLQQQRTDLEEQLILANKDKEIWKTKYEIIYAKHKDANNLRNKYDLLKAKFDTAVLVASVSTDGEREKAEEEMRKAEQDKLIMDEEKLDLEKDFEKWEKDFKRQHGRKSEVNDRPEATQELFQNCQDADHKVNVLDAKIMTIQSLMNGEVPRSPEIEPEEVKVAEPVVTVIEVAVPNTQLQVELEMTQMELDATKRQILALQSDSTAQMDSMALLKAELSDSEHETNKLRAMQNELERQLFKAEQDLIRAKQAKQAKPETVSEAQQKDLIVQQRLKVDPELTEAKETEPVSSVEIQHPNQPLQRAEENLHSLDVAASVQMEIDAAELEIEALKRQINALQDQLIDKEHTLEEKEEQLKDKDHEILTNNRKHEEELREKDKKIKDMEKDIRKLLKHMAKLKKQLAQESKEPIAEDKADDHLEDRVTDLEKQILDIQGENKGLSAEKKILETNNKDLENKIVELRQELKALRKQGVVRREPSSVRREPSAVAAVSANANTDSGRQMRKQEKLLKELEKLLDIERKKAKKNSDNMKKLEEEMRDVQKDNKDKENEIQKLKAELATLGVSAAEAVQMSKEIKKLKRDIKKLGDENKTLGDNFNSERVLRKKYYNMVEDMKGKIRVFCRVRPMSKDELGRGNTSVVKSADEYTVSVNSSRGTKEFQFDTIFMPESTQDKVFEDTHNLIQSAVDGYNVCIFAYGQTGSGKTFTIIGDREQAHPGIAPRAFTGIFDLLKENKSKFSYKVTCYMLELYNDKLVDLFSSSGHHLDDEKLVIKKDNKGLVEVQGAEIKTARNDKELFALFQEGSKTRHTASTKMNAESSRSHLVIGILIETTNKATGTMTKGKLSLVDLAGSERAGKTEASAEQLKEAMSINKSLSALGDVISALSSEQQFIPYRNNKLTMLMQDSLGGNAKTLMFVNISPANYNQDESVISLMYASRVKLITNDAQKNADNKEISRLKAVLAKFKKGNSATDDADG